MKPKLTLIAVLLIVASCATESTQTPDPAATHKTVAVENAKPKAAPKPKPYPLETCLASFAVSAEHPSVTNPNPILP